MEVLGMYVGLLVTINLIYSSYFNRINILLQTPDKPVPSVIQI